MREGSPCLYPALPYNPTSNAHARKSRGGPIVDVRVRDAERVVPMLPLLDGGHAGLAPQPAADAHLDALQWSHKCGGGMGKEAGRGSATLALAADANLHAQTARRPHKCGWSTAHARPKPRPQTDWAITSDTPSPPLPLPHLDEGISLDAADEEALDALPRHVGLQRRCNVRGDHRRALEDIVEEKGSTVRGGSGRSGR